MPKRAYLGLGLFSGAGLLLEIALTRLFSTLFYPTFVFALLSLAVLGLGWGAATAVWRGPTPDNRPIACYLAGASATTLLLLAVTTWTTAVPPLLFFLAAWPYYFVGLSLATLFGRAATASPRLYAADLLGAGLGVLLAVPLLNGWGPLQVILGAAVLFALAGLLIAPARVAWASLLMAALLWGGQVWRGWLAVDMAALAGDKPISQSLQPNGRLLATRWDALARTDLVAPAAGGNYQLYIDGAAGSVMPTLGREEQLWRDIGFFPLATAQPQRVFVIGSGGGLDVWFGLQSGAARITAVEVNRASVEMVRAWAAENGALYDQPAVRVVLDEGRSVLRREGQRYDLILLSQVVTLAADPSGYHLVENNVYTVEAFGDYFEHLTPTGQIALKLYDELTLSRALSTAIAMLNQRGLSDAQALEHLLVIVDNQVNPAVPLLLIGRAPFSRDDSLALGAVAREVGFEPLFLPHVLAQPPLQAVQNGDSTYAEIIARTAANIAPPRDDWPFFFQFEHGVPQNLRPLMGAVLALVLVVRGILPFIPDWLRLGRQRGAVRPLLYYFAAVGVGFMVVEVVLIQQVRLFVGPPTWAITAVLGTLLIGGGIGSYVTQWSRRWPNALVVLLLLVWGLVWPTLNQQFLASPLPVRLLVVVLALLPLALAMGRPFPLGLQLAGQIDRRLTALGWAVNGLMSVVGSVGALALALHNGFGYVLVAGGIAYATAAILYAVICGIRN